MTEQEQEQILTAPYITYYCVYPHGTRGFMERYPGESAPICDPENCPRKALKKTIKAGKLVEACHYRRLHDPKDYDADYTEQNARNIINIYQEELLKIHRGATASLMFTFRQLRALKSYGIVEKADNNFSRVVLTEKAVNALSLEPTKINPKAYHQSPKYWCTRCRIEHFKTSGIGKMHWGFRRLKRLK